MPTTRNLLAALVANLGKGIVNIGIKLLDESEAITNDKETVDHTIGFRTGPSDITARDTTNNRILERPGNPIPDTPDMGGGDDSELRVPGGSDSENHDSRQRRTTNGRPVVPVTPPDDPEDGELYFIYHEHSLRPVLFAYDRGNWYQIPTRYTQSYLTEGGQTAIDAIMF